MPTTDIRRVRSFWERHPVGAAAVPHAPGTREFFEHYDRLREANEPLPTSYEIHEYARFSGQRVLDVGCGNGYVLSKYAAEGAEPFGIDITTTAVDVSRRRFELLGLKGSFAVGSAERLPYPDSSFDCVCSMGVLHHTPDTPGAVAEIHRVLKPDGHLIVMLYHRGSAFYRWTLRLRSWATRRSRDELVNEVDGVGNPKGAVYSKNEMRSLLRRFDRQELSVGVLNGWMVLPRGGRFLPPRFLARMAPRWGWFLYAKARKPA